MDVFEKDVRVFAFHFLYLHLNPLFTTSSLISEQKFADMSRRTTYKIWEKGLQPRVCELDDTHHLNCSTPRILKHPCIFSYPTVPVHGYTGYFWSHVIQKYTLVNSCTWWQNPVYIVLILNHRSAYELMYPKMIGTRWTISHQDLWTWILAHLWNVHLLGNFRKHKCMALHTVLRGMVCVHTWGRSWWPQ
jgi:hypothetical protein